MSTVTASILGVCAPSFSTRTLAICKTGTSVCATTSASANVVRCTCHMWTVIADCHVNIEYTARYQHAHCLVHACLQRDVCIFSPIAYMMCLTVRHYPPDICYLCICCHEPLPPDIPPVLYMATSLLLLAFNNYVMAG